MVYAAMDVHRKRSQLAVLEDGGTQVMNRRVRNRREDLAPLLEVLDPGTPVAFEAAYGWRWLVDLLEELDLEPRLAHPLRCKAIASARLKNDKVDAATLAHLLRADLLAEAWIAPKEVRDQRALLRMRARLVAIQSAAKNRIHAMLADLGIEEEPERLWTKAGQRWLEGVELPDVQRLLVDCSLELIDSVHEPIARLEKEIRVLTKPDLRVHALQALSGIGPYTAMTLVAEIGDIARFPSPRKLCAWAGLTPNVRNSADRVRHGHITKQGPRAVRWVLVEAAHTAKRRPPYAGDFAAIAHRRGKPIATVAIARKLLARCYWVLKEAS